MSADQLARALEQIANHRMSMYGSDDFFHLQKIAREALAAHRAQAVVKESLTTEAVAWRDHVEQRLSTWRQGFVNKSGDQLALDDFMDKESLADLLDYVLDEYASPHQVAQQWIAVGERMPDPGINVLACFRYGGTGRAQVVRAMHAPQFTCSEDQFGEFLGDGGEYDEKTDATYWPEGWYESNEAEETSWRLHEEVTHWMPLPAVPTKEPTNG